MMDSSSDSDREIEVEDIPALDEEAEETSHNAKPAALTGKAKKNKKRLQRRKTLRKRQEKKRAKRLKEKEAAGVAVVERPEKESAREMSLHYLRQWQADRAAWKFSKVRQTWLLKAMLDPEKLPRADFKILLQYVAGLQGCARTTTLQQLAALSTEGADVPDGVSLKRVGKVQAVLRS